MKNKLFTIIILAVLVIGSIFFAYQKGLHNQCTVIDLHSDYTFTCDGRVIQGPNYAKSTLANEWEFHSSVK